MTTIVYHFSAGYKLSIRPKDTVGLGVMSVNMNSRLFQSRVGTEVKYSKAKRYIMDGPSYALDLASPKTWHLAEYISGDVESVRIAGHSIRKPVVQARLD